MLFVEEVVVISRRFVHDDDLRLCLFGRKRGIFWGIAKHGRKSRRRFLNLLEPPSLINVYVRGYPRTSQASAMFHTFFGGHIIESAEIIDIFPSIKSDIVKVLSSWYIMELTRAVGFSPEVFPLLVDSLEELECSESFEFMDILANFSAEILALEGFITSEGKADLKRTKNFNLVKSIVQDIYGRHFKFLDIPERILTVM